MSKTKLPVSGAAWTLGDFIRSVVPASVKTAAVRFLTGRFMNKCVGALFDSRIPHYGCRIFLAPENRDRAAHIFFRLYERCEIAMIRRFLPSNLDVVELGASLGVTTCQIAKRLGPDHKLVCVEANPYLIDSLKQTLAINDIRNVTVVAKAISYDGEPEIRFGLSTSNLGGRVRADGELSVKTTNLKELTAEYGVRDYVLVVDIEGGEIPIFIANQASLAGCRMVLIETGGGLYKSKSYGKEAVFQLIQSAGFNLIYRYGHCAAFAAKQRAPEELPA